VCRDVAVCRGLLVAGTASAPTHENQGLLPGEVTAGVAALSVVKDEAPVVETAGLRGQSHL
jgi:hypothetical protein